MLEVDSFLGDFIQDKVLYRLINECTFGADLDDEQADVPLYDQFNAGLSGCEKGYERDNLALDGNNAPVLKSQAAMQAQEIARYPGSQTAVMQGNYQGKELAPMAGTNVEVTNSMLPQGEHGNRSGTTGYIPSLEQGMETGKATRPTGQLMMTDLGQVPDQMLMMSMRRRGLIQ